MVITQHPLLRPRAVDRACSECLLVPVTTQRLVAEPLLLRLLLHLPYRQATLSIQELLLTILFPVQTSKDTIGLSSSDLELRAQSLALVRPSPLLPALALLPGPAPWHRTIGPSRCQRCHSPRSKPRQSQGRRGPSRMPSKREFSRATSTWTSGAPTIHQADGDLVYPARPIACHAIRHLGISLEFYLFLMSFSCRSTTSFINLWKTSESTG
jgi:hypothetical protein